MGGWFVFLLCAQPDDFIMKCSSLALASSIPFVSPCVISSYDDFCTYAKLRS